jgi:hypothetical protein
MRTQILPDSPTARNAHAAAPLLDQIDRRVAAIAHRRPRLQPALYRVYSLFLALWVAVAGLPATARYFASPACYLISLHVIAQRAHYWYVTLRAYWRHDWLTLWIAGSVALLWPLLAYSWYLLFMLTWRH